jgi:hypothetical protein
MASLSPWKGETAAHAALICFGWLALVSIGTFFAVADCGSGIEISSTPFSNLAAIFSGSTPFGSAKVRSNLP